MKRTALLAAAVLLVVGCASAKRSAGARSRAISVALRISTYNTRTRQHVRQAQWVTAQNKGRPTAYNGPSHDAAYLEPKRGRDPVQKDDATGSRQVMAPLAVKRLGKTAADP